MKTAPVVRMSWAFASSWAMCAAALFAATCGLELGPVGLGADEVLASACIEGRRLKRGVVREEGGLVSLESGLDVDQNGPISAERRNDRRRDDSENLGEEELGGLRTRLDTHTNWAGEKSAAVPHAATDRERRHFYFYF